MAESNLTRLAISNDNLFTEKLNLLERFSRQIPIEVNLPTVPTEGGLFGWFDHSVTGEELNNIIEKIQKLMIKQNTTLTKVSKEFINIYETFNTLDKSYIQKILIAINTAIRAIDDANFANERIDEQQKEIIGDQQDIKQVIDRQKQIIQVLKNFKEKLENIDHLYDIDKIFSNSQNFQIKIEFLEQSSVEQKVSIEKISERQTDFEMSLSKLRDLNSELSLELTQSVQVIDRQKQIIQVLKDFKEKLEKIDHLYDIDKIFSNSQNFQIKIEFLEQSSVEQKVSIEKISERQTDFEMSLSKLRDLNSELSLELKQSITETEQRFSEIKQNIEKNYEEHIDKYNSLAVSLVSAKESIQDVYSKTNYKIEQVSKETNNKYEAIQNDLTTLRYENAALSKSLMVTRIILATGFLFLLILIILFLTGVIK